jgi:hypothetical protein
MDTEGARKPKRSRKRRNIQKSFQPSKKRKAASQPFAEEPPLEDTLAETQYLVLRLLRSLLYEEYDYVVYLDNLFTNLPLL